MTKTIYFLTFIDVLSLGLFLPTASVHVLSLGGTQLTAGLFSSLHSFLQLLFGPLIGSWSDTRGRKPLLILTSLGLLLSNLLLGIHSLHIYFLSRIVFGCSSHIQILLKALVTDYYASENHVSVFGKMGAVGALSFIIGPIIGGHVMELDNGFSYIVAILTALNVISIGVYVMIPHTDITKKTEGVEKINPFTNLMKVDWKTYYDIFLLKFLIECSCAMFFQTFGLVLTVVYTTTRTQLGYIIALMSLSMILTNLLFSKMKEVFYHSDFDYKKRNYHGIVGMLIIFITLYLLPSFWMYFLTMIPFACFKVVLDTTWLEIVVGRTTENDKGTVMGAFESMVALAGLGSPLLAGFISTYYDYNMTIAVCTIPAAAATILVATHRRKLNKLN